MMEQEVVDLVASSGHRKVAAVEWSVAIATCALKESASVANDPALLVEIISRSVRHRFLFAIFEAVERPLFAVRAGSGALASACNVIASRIHNLPTRTVIAVHRA